MVLKGHHHISTQALYNAVVEAENETKRQAKKKGKKKGKAIAYETESNRDDEEEVEDQSESDVEDCIIVEIELVGDLFSWGSLYMRENRVWRDFDPEELFKFHSFDIDKLHDRDIFGTIVESRQWYGSVSVTLPPVVRGWLRNLALR